MADTPMIPDSEFQQRWQTLQQKMDEHDLDVVITHGHEADPANVRYLSDYWPLFSISSLIWVPGWGRLWESFLV